MAASTRKGFDPSKGACKRGFQGGLIRVIHMAKKFRDTIDNYGKMTAAEWEALVSDPPRGGKHHDHECCNKSP
jgi:hypothetical protein